MKPTKRFPTLCVILCIFTAHGAASNAESIDIAEVPVALQLPFDHYAILNNRKDFQGGSEISASTFRYIAENIVSRYLPAVGNKEVFGGEQLFEKPLQKEMDNVKDRMQRETGYYVYRLPCVENLRCFIFGFPPGYWLLTFNDKGEFQDAALIYVNMWERDERTREQLRATLIHTEFEEVDRRLQSQIKDPQRTKISDTYLDFESLGFFCSKLYHLKIREPEYSRYRLSRVNPSGKIEVVYEGEATEQNNGRCSLPRQQFNELMQRMTRESGGKNPFGV